MAGYKRFELEIDFNECDGVLYRQDLIQRLQLLRWQLPLSFVKVGTKLAVFMKTLISTFYNPDNDTKNSCSNSYCNNTTDKHLIFSFRIDEKRTNNIGKKKRIYNNFYIRGEFEKEFTGKSSSNSYLCNIHQTFCQKFSSATSDIHFDLDHSVLQLRSCVKMCKKW